MKLINVFTSEVMILNVICQCSLNQIQPTRKFYYNRRLFFCQLIGVFLYFFIINLVSNYELKLTGSTNFTTPTLVQFSEEHNSPDVIVSNSLISIHETFMNFVMVIVLLMRWTKQKRIAKIYNNLLDIQNQIEGLKLGKIKVTPISRQFIKRSVVMLLFEAMFGIDEFQPYAFRETKTKAFTVFLHRIVFRFALLQLFTFYDVLLVQTRTLTRQLTEIRTISEMEKLHRILMKIIHTKKLIDKTLSKEFVLDVANTALYIVLTLYLYCVRAEKELNVLYHTEDVFLNERSIAFLTLWMFYSFHVVTKTRVALEILSSKLQEVSDQFKPTMSFYSLTNFSASKKGFKFSHSFVDGADKGTFWTIMCSSFSVLMIVLQFRDITTLRRSAQVGGH